MTLKKEVWATVIIIINLQQANVVTAAKYRNRSMECDPDHRGSRPITLSTYLGHISKDDKVEGREHCQQMT